MTRENTLLSEYFSVFLFEDLPAKSRPARRVYMEGVAKSDIYLGILGSEYGATGTDGVSATEQEFREAQKRNKDILIYIKGADDSSRDKREKRLIEVIENPDSGYRYKRFNSIAEIKNGIYESLVDFLRDKGIVGKVAFDKTVCEDTVFDDIDDRKIEWFLRRARLKRNYPVDIKASAEEALIHLNLLNNGYLTNAAILLFGSNPHKFHLQAEIKCIQFPGTQVEKPFASYHIYTDNLFEQIDKSISFVLDTIHFPVIQQEGTAEVKRPYEIPPFVIQEAIINAAAHRDYNCTGAVQVMVFVDRIEVWNPGKLPSRLTIESLKKPHTSYPNNPLLAEVLYLADYIQKAGSGTLEMIKQCRERGLPEPEFLETRGEFRTVIARDLLTENVLTKLGLNERQMKAVIYVKEKGRITNREYRLINSISDEGARIDLKVLVKKSVLKSKGRGRSVSYVLKSGD
jgi:predicted HTH transcriptional regulator